SSYTERRPAPSSPPAPPQRLILRRPIEPARPRLTQSLRMTAGAARGRQGLHSADNSLLFGPRSTHPRRALVRNPPAVGKTAGETTSARATQSTEARAHLY